MANFLDGLLGGIRNLKENGTPKPTRDTLDVVGATIEDDGEKLTMTITAPSRFGALADGLRNTIGDEEGQIEFLRGFSTDGDGGGGYFKWRATATATDDGGTVLNKNGYGNAATGYWQRIDATSGPWSAAWFGTVGNAAFATGTGDADAITVTISGLTTADIGKMIAISGAGAAGAVYLGTIAGVSGSTITLAEALVTSVVDAPVLYGTDDTVALQRAINAAKVGRTLTFAGQHLQTTSLDFAGARNMTVLDLAGAWHACTGAGTDGGAVPLFLVHDTTDLTVECYFRGTFTEDLDQRFDSPIRTDNTISSPQTETRRLKIRKCTSLNMHGDFVRLGPNTYDTVIEANHVEDGLGFIEFSGISAASAVTQVGGGPAITVQGMPLRDGSFKIEVTTGGAFGVGVVRWSEDGGATWEESGITLSASHVLGTTGLTAVFAEGTYVLSATYTWSIDFRPVMNTKVRGGNEFKGTPVGRNSYRPSGISGSDDIIDFFGGVIDCVIEGNVIDGRCDENTATCANHGVIILPVDGVGSIYGLKIRRNTFRNIHSDGHYSKNAAVHLDDSTSTFDGIPGLDVDDNDFDNCYIGFFNDNAAGLIVNGGVEIRSHVRLNRFRDCIYAAWLAGVPSVSGADWTVEDNTSLRCNGSKAFRFHGDRHVVRRNKVLDSTYREGSWTADDNNYHSDIYVTVGSDCEFTDNTCVGALTSGVVGLRFVAGTDHLCQNNHVSNHDIGIQAQSTSVVGLVLRDNRHVGNTTKVDDAGDGTSFDRGEDGSAVGATFGRGLAYNGAKTVGLPLMTHATASTSEEVAGTDSLLVNGIVRTYVANFLLTKSDGTVMTATRKAVFKRFAGTTDQVGVTRQVGPDEPDGSTPAWACDIDHDGHTIQFLVTTDETGIDATVDVQYSENG